MNQPSQQHPNLFSTMHPATYVMALLFLVLTRIAIGWHFLYEGLVKFYKPDWSSRVYLEMAHGPFGTLFQQMAENDALLALSDLGVKWALVLAGLSLMLGLFTRLGCLVAAGLLVMFYAANPAWGGVYSFGIMAPGSEGHYLLVNKNLIELLAVLALMFLPTGRVVGLDALVLSPLDRFCPMRKTSGPSAAAQQ